MRLLIAAAVSLLAAPAFAQQSPSNTGTPVTPNVTSTPGTGMAHTGANVVGKGTKTTLHSHHRNVSFKSTFMAAAPDGHLTLDQAKAAGLNRTAARFSQIDTDNKGYVTYDQTVAYFRAQQHAMPGGKGNR